jgi:hypothetical protein
MTRDYWPLAEYEDKGLIVSLYVIHFFNHLTSHSYLTGVDLGKQISSKDETFQPQLMHDQYTALLWLAASELISSNLNEMLFGMIH